MSNEKVMVLLHKFSQMAADALNEQKVVPPEVGGDERSACALMVVVGIAPQPPMATSLNYDRENSFWRVDPMAQESQKHEEN